MIRKKRMIPVGIALLFLLFTSPFWIWQLKPSQELNMLIMDKTVPDESYREHKGLVWLLNHLKLRKSGNEAYDSKQDYVGFVPADQPPEFTVRELPEDLSPYDVLYVADSYGVYKDEYDGENQEGNRSELLYGGLTTDEVNRIGDSLIKHNQTLIAEFNTFGSPTEPTVREGFYDFLHVKWTGWMGRYFHDLSNDEVPIWLKQNYEKQYGEEYRFKGNGLVFVSEEDKVIVLTEKEISDEPVQFTLTEKGRSEYELNESISYNYWFDIIEPYDGEEVQAQFELSLSNKGEEKLKSSRIPLTFPAVVHHQAKLYDSYYFAGDFADQEKTPNFYRMSGITWWQQLFSFGGKGRTDTFYWEAYAPMMKEILTKKKEVSSSDEALVPGIQTVNDMKVIGKSGDDYLQVYKNGAWGDLLIKGVNMGIAKPGSFPGETKISKSEYARWFEQISAMNANALRVYTIHPPAFYQALYEHNRNRKNPLYLFQGVWVNEEIFLDKKNAFDPAVMGDFKKEIQRTVDLIHGNAEIEERAGHASGTYAHDLSPYVLGWILGVEWDPEGVVGTNEKNADRTSFNGTYIMTEEATPFEAWLAEVMDFTAVYEAENYGWQHPLSFTNWVTTDLLSHPAEPNLEEDLVSVNPNVIKAKDSFYPGLFASYHIYPYYPDFLNFEEEYVEYVDHRGKKNNYAGYLHDMKEHHNMPLLVAEFGIPASRGLTHENVYGFDQGNHSEQEQGNLVKSLFEDIVEEKMAGGLVFSWQDEWFKRTWNTMDYDNPDRRPFWDNIQTNEQHFGLLSFEPDTKDTQLLVDGDPADWKARGEKSIITNEKGPVKKVYMSSDAKGLFLRIDYDQEQWKDDLQASILLNTIPNQGQSTIPEVPSAKEEGIDFLVELNGKEHSRVLIDSYYDTFYYAYGQMLQMIQTESYASTPNNGVYHPIRLTLNKELTINREEGPVMTVPFSAYETGKLTYGNGNPESTDFNSLADFYMKDGLLELRLPWLLLNVKDPSHKEIMGNIWSNEALGSSEKIDSISAAVIVTNKEKEMVQRVPSQSAWMSYTWENWDEPVYHERLKKSYEVMKEAFSD
ncbi:hypothetical protein [Niallia endozanthoxylica]|uniref:Uncharacterized protein n=1 Tax=Niallia endozanthoxylica TaxID=2036016 RepID=A0A5J5I8R7_9BACI|nr:hypothetical protein [Niallia endozanthoxylica]KAA9032424.1 hypothetical protein F4V44_00310 [Niallia endozanthoxylica]